MGKCSEYVPMRSDGHCSTCANRGCVPCFKCKLIDECKVYNWMQGNVTFHVGDGVVDCVKIRRHVDRCSKFVDGEKPMYRATCIYHCGVTASGAIDCKVRGLIDDDECSIQYCDSFVRRFKS